MSIPSPMYIPPGQDPTGVEFEPPRSAPGCWRIVAVILVILVAVAACGGFGAGASLSQRPTPTDAPTLTPSVTPAGTLPTPTRTPTGTLTPTATREPLYAGDAGQQPTATLTPTDAPTNTPAPCVGYHRVKPGQFVSQIASMWWISSSALIRANKLRNPDLLYVGQILIIPGRCTRTATPTPAATGLP